MSLPYLTRFYKVIDATSNLSILSKKAYKDRLRRLTILTNQDVNWIIMHCHETYDTIKQYQWQTQKSYINSVLTLFKYTKDLKKKYKKIYDCWYNLFVKVNAKTEEKYLTMTASDRQKAAYIAWPDILKIRDELDKDSIQYLLLCMYTMIPPSRADMNAIKIYYKKIPENIKKNPNYLVISDNIKLVYNEFKSKSRRLQKYEKILPIELENIIRKSLKDNPRDFLIVSPRNNLPYHNTGSFTRYFDRMLEKIFKKKVTINTLRHSFVNSLDLNKLTPLEKEIISRDLMHSKDTMDKYRLAI
jgi:transcription termination factor NusB